MPQPWIHNSSSEGEHHDVDDVLLQAPNNPVEQHDPHPVVHHDPNPMEDEDQEFLEQSRYDYVIGN